MLRTMLQPARTNEMTVSELIARLSVMNPDALVIKAYSHHNQTMQEYVEINDHLDVVDVKQSKGRRDYHWFEMREGRDFGDDFLETYTVKEAVVI
jgi:hypothetical protein